MTEIYTLRVDKFSTPMGEMQVYQDEEYRLYALDWTEFSDRTHAYFDNNLGSNGWVVTEGKGGNVVIDKLRAYLDGEIAVIDDLKVQLFGSDFQLQLWQALRQISVGTTRTYGDLARELSNIGASRAVGVACGANPVAIVVPCHRVLGANQSMTGYSSGLERKTWLLRHENALRCEQLNLF